MTFSFAIRTVPARRTHFMRLMREVLAQTAHPSVRGVHVSADPFASPNANGTRALEAAVADETDWIIFLEDDAGLIHDFVGSVERWLLDHHDPNVHIYPLGAQYAEAHDWKSPVWRYRLKDYYCSVAFAVRATLVPALVWHFKSVVACRQGFDLELVKWHQSVSPSPHLLTPVPCFVEHLGDDSTLIDGRSMKNVVGRFRGFGGYDFTYKGHNG
jgi:hypothetical protein